MAELKIGAPWDSVVDLGKDLLDKIFPDKTEAEQAKAALVLAQQQGDLQQLQAMWENAKAQAQVNDTEAKSASVFVAGWRPAVGWVCVTALFWNFVLFPMLSIVLLLVKHDFDVSKVPELDWGFLGQLLLGILGLGAMRTYEKIKGAAPPSHA